MSEVCKAFCKRKAFGFRKRANFFSSCKAQRKTFSQRTAATTSHRTKANEQLQILSTTTYCELAVHLLIFVKTSVLRLHCGNPFAPIQSLYAGVLQAKPVSAGAAENFCKITSGRALNRPRSPEVRKPLVYFWFFSYTRKE